VLSESQYWGTGVLARALKGPIFLCLDSARVAIVGSAFMAAYPLCTNAGFSPKPKLLTSTRGPCRNL
jgi:hypothetical protein